MSSVAGERATPGTAAAPRRATLVGGLAIALWSTLALLTTLAGAVPPLQLTAMAFGLAFALSLATWLARGESPMRHLRQPPRVWALGVGGLFGYHVCYFAALSWAPPAAANLINYLWPLLIVMFAGLLPGERLRWWHIAGAVSGLAGCALLIGGGAAFDGRFVAGYAAALAAALAWSSYSVLSRRFGAVPTDAVGGFCGATAALALVAHLLFEQTRWPDGVQWLAVAAMGVGPVGAAFFLWDHGVKRGDIKALGALSYITPLLSTGLLIAFGRAEPSLNLLLSCVLIVGGAVLASRDMWRRKA